MPMINVAKPFILTLATGKTYYEPGEQEVDAEVAEHWFTQAHLVGFEEPPPPRGSQQYAQAALNTEQAVRLAEPVSGNLQPPAPLPPDVERAASRTGLVPDGAHYFAGQPQTDKPLPTETEQPARVSFLGHAPPS